MVFSLFQAQGALLALAPSYLSRAGAWPVPLVLALWLLAALACFAIGSLLGAIWLRLAVWLGGLPDIEFVRALKTVLVVNLTWGGISTMLMTPFMTALLNPPTGMNNQSWQFSFLSPASLAPIAAGAVLAHAVLFSHLLKEQGQPMPFGRSCFLSLLYLGVAALGMTAILLVVVLVYALAAAV